MQGKVGSLSGRDCAVVLFLLAAYLCTVLIVGPGGDFPLNDDWSFAESTRRLVHQHDWRPLGWASMPQITQALWGATTCLLASCSYEALRTSSLLLGAVLLGATYALVLHAGGSRLTAGLVSAISVFNPITYPLLYTYMTDTIFEVLLVLGALACARALRDRSAFAVVLTALLVTAATLCRQLGLCLGAGFAIAYGLSSRERLLPRAIKAVAPTLVAMAALLLFEHWMRVTGRLPAAYDQKTQAMLAVFHLPAPDFVRVTLRNAAALLMYLGVLLAPLGFWQLARSRVAFGSGRVIAHAAGMGAALMCLLSMWRDHMLMPLLGNVFVKAGVGPLSLRDTYVLHLPSVVELPPAFWFGVSALGLFGAWALTVRSVAFVGDVLPAAVRGRLKPKDALPMLGIVSVVAYLLPLLVSSFFYDRYLAVVMPLATLVLLPRWSSPDHPGNIPALTLALAGGLLSVLATHDYLSWNRARWRAIAMLEKRGLASSATLDGGFEYNGSRGYDPAWHSRPGRSWWWVRDDRFQLSFGPMPGVRTIARFPFRAYLWRGDTAVQLSRRLE